MFVATLFIEQETGKTQVLWKGEGRVSGDPPGQGSSIEQSETMTDTTRVTTAGLSNTCRVEEQGTEKHLPTILFL